MAAIDGRPGSGGAPDGAGDTIGGDVEAMFGGDGPDTLSGNAAANYLDGGAGDDTLDSRDSEADFDACGAGVDTALVDAFDDSADCGRFGPAPAPGPAVPVPTRPAVAPTPVAWPPASSSCASPRGRAAPSPGSAASGSRWS